jgi:hypothetical protein
MQKRSHSGGALGLDTIYGGPRFDLCDGGSDSPDTVFQCEKKLNIPSAVTVLPNIEEVG